MTKLEEAKGLISDFLLKSVSFGNEGDLYRARAGLIAIRATKSKDVARALIVEAVPNTSPRTAAFVVRTGSALRLIPNERIWKAVGWRGVRDALKLDPKKRDEVLLQALAEFDARGRHLSKGRVSELVSDPAKKATRPAARKARQPAEKPAQARQDPTPSGQTYQEELLARDAEIERLKARVREVEQKAEARVREVEQKAEARVREVEAHSREFELERDDFATEIDRLMVLDAVRVLVDPSVKDRVAVRVPPEKSKRLRA